MFDAILRWAILIIGTGLPGYLGYLVLSGQADLVLYLNPHVKWTLFGNLFVLVAVSIMAFRAKKPG